MGRTSALEHDASLDVTASTTAEMLAALPEGLMLPTGTTPEERRGTGILAPYPAGVLESTPPTPIVDHLRPHPQQNAAHQALIGYGAEELQGQTPAIHLGDEVFGSIAEELQRRGVSRREVLSRARDGTTRIIDISSFAVRDRAGQPVCYVGIKRDVTEQRRSADELTRRFEELNA